MSIVGRWQSLVRATKRTSARRSSAWLAAALILAAWSTLGPGGDRIASASVSVGTPSSTALPGVATSVVVDAVNQHVFVSIPTAGVVDVLDYSGNLVKTITGLAVSPSAYAHEDELASGPGEVYVADTNSGVIDEINPTTLAIDRQIATGLVTPYALVSAGAYLWTTTGAQWPPPSLVRVDPANGTTVTYSGLLEGAGLVADGSLPDTLFSYDPGFSPVTVNRIDVSSTPEVTASQDQYSPAISNVNDVAVSPDGSYLVPAGGSPYQFDEISSSTLANRNIDYPASPYPTAVAMTPQNGGLFAGGINGIYSSDLDLYPLNDQSDLLFSYQFPSGNGSTNDEVVPGGLAFSPDGTRLFVVTADGSGSGSTFHVFTIGPVQGVATTTTVTSSLDPSAFGQLVTFSATVAPTHGGGSVSFYADGSSSPISGCAWLSLSLVSGAYKAQCQDAALAVGTHTVTARYSGEDGYAGSAGQLSGGQTVNRAPTSMSAQPATVSSSHSVSFTATLTSAVTGSGIAAMTVSFTVGTTKACSGSTNASGVASCTWRPASSGSVKSAKSYTASFAGSAGYLASRATGTITQ